MTNTLKRTYSYWFIVPAAIIYLYLFIFPTVMSLFFSMTRWTLTEWEFIGFDNFISFFKEPQLVIGFKNTFIYGVLTTTLKVVFGLLLGVVLTSKIKTKNYLRSVIFFPALLSTIAVGIAFSMMMHPSEGLINSSLAAIGISGPDWLGDIRIALFSIIFVDVWKGVGIATVIFIAGILSIPEEYYEALKMDGGNSLQKFWYITIPLCRPATNSVIILALIGGLRSFDLVWAMTRGGPGFATDQISSIIYKQYQMGFYGLSTAGNVILFVIVTLVAVPLYSYLNRKLVDL